MYVEFVVAGNWRTSGILSPLFQEIDSTISDATQDS